MPDPPSAEPKSAVELTLERVLPVAERFSPGISATVAPLIETDRQREEVRAYQPPSVVTPEAVEAGEAVTLERMIRSFTETVDALAVAPKGAVNRDFDAVVRLRGILAVARAKDRAHNYVVQARSWKETTDRIDSLYRQFGDTPPIPRLPKLEAELAWRSAAAAAGIQGGDRGAIRRLRAAIEDEGGVP